MERKQHAAAVASPPAALLAETPSGAGRPSQSPLPRAAQSGEAPKHRLPRRQFASLNDFLVSEANRLSLTAAQTAASRPGTYSPLTFVGPPGCGKTHPLEGIWRRVREERTVQRVVYLSAEQFTNQFLDALKHSGMPSFRRKCREVELLLIDDVQFFGRAQTTTTELVHTIDALLREGRQLVFAADRPPAELKALGPEFVARLSGGLICTLQPADYSTRLGILRLMAARHSIKAPEEVFSWIAGQFDGDARLLGGALNRLSAMSHAHQESIDLRFAQMALDDLVQTGRRTVRLPDIVDAVCDVFGFPAAELQGGSRSTSTTLPRMLVMFLARKWTRAALSDISRALGRKSHSTVVSAEQKVTQWLAAGKLIPLAHSQCRVEDAIKRVEARLRLA
jgi:chromosomal replication initiator protein